MSNTTSIKPIIFSLYALAVILVAMSGWAIVQKSAVSSQTKGPSNAVVDALSGAVSKRSDETGQSIRLDRSDELLPSNILEVPGSKGGTEHWVHLRFRGVRKSALVQAGTDPNYTEYRFPCQYSKGTGLWGLRQTNNNGCEHIGVQSRGWRNKHKNMAQKPAMAKNAHRILIAQEDASELTVRPVNALTLVYIHENGGNTVINVLTGAARVKSGNTITTVGAGIRYTDFGDGKRGERSDMPEETYNSRPLQIFLDPNTWSSDIRFQVQEFQKAVDEARERPIPVPTTSPTSFPDPNKPGTNNPPQKSPESPPARKPAPQTKPSPIINPSPNNSPKLN
ncbi:MAG: hypothetical protein KME27_28065 [Lyngbya sp. HA4199-MV5]|jgi:hypothetical protein|nr:hypothetical protein [Lyngbya sp. HA4199-MV5]